MPNFEISEQEALDKLQSVTGEIAKGEGNPAQDFMDKTQKEDEINKRDSAKKELLKELIPTIEEEIKNRSSSLTVSQWQSEKAVLVGEIAKLRQEIETFKGLILRAKAQGKATIPPENVGENSELKQIYGDMFEFLNK